LGNTYHVAIGQGDLALTPIEVNQAIAAVATGKLCQPKIGGGGECRDLQVDGQNLEVVREGMGEACSEGGTGYTFFDFIPGVSCKTGTAETNVDGKTHAWFSVFAPREFPEIIMTVLVEGGGEGSRVAGPLARDIFDFWYNKGG
jgi:penicillin-binding protein 2